MGKIIKERQNKARRDAGPFHPLERIAADSRKEIEDLESSAEDAKASLSRGQRRRMARKVQHARKHELVELAKEKAITIKEGTLGDLRLLSLNLPQNTAKSALPKQNTKMTRKARQRITSVEIAQFQAVLAHPAFQANPLTTIQDHLENSIKAAR